MERDLEKALHSIGFAADTAGYEAMRDVARVVAGYAIENRARLHSLDINPLIINAAGAAIAADALIEMILE